MGNMITVFSTFLLPQNLGVIAAGCFFGIFVGVMPGLSSLMGLTIMLPITFILKGSTGILMMIGIYCGAIYGGSVTASLINTPGTSNSAATCLDGYPLSVKYGQPGRAIGMSTYASTFGGFFSALMLLWTAPLLAKIALKFGPEEYFGLAIFGLSIVTGISGKNIIKSLLGACLGLVLSMVGVDILTGDYRFTFGSNYLAGGIPFVPVLIGLFAFSQGFISVEEAFWKKEEKIKVPWIKKVLPSFLDIRNTFPTVLRSSIIGTIVGAIPGTGGDIACWIAYNEAKRWSKNPEKFGDGAIEGIAAPESANNAVTGGALIPLLTLAIPGDACTAVMLGALMMQGIIPGPNLFVENPVMVHTIVFGLFMANAFMCVMGFAGLNLFSKIVSIPKKIMTPMIFVFCFVGTYALNHDMNDVTLMIISGILGYFILKFEFSIPPIILGIILGKTAEENLRRSYVISDGDPFIFFKKPISCALLIFAFFSLIYPIVFPYIKHKLTARKVKA